MSRALACVVASVLTCGALPARAATPNDPAFTTGIQWGLEKIRAVEAWRVTMGAGSIVAVLDTGVYAGHPDLRNQVLRGTDFASTDDDPSDDNGHGTLVSGIIAARTFNNAGVASVAPSAKILPVRVLDGDGNGTSGDVARGIRGAVTHGADVINLSLAHDREHGLTASDELLQDPLVDGAIRRAIIDGAVVVVAAGNDNAGGQPETAYRGGSDGLLVVGASTSGDRLAAYSNYGVGLDLLAPGGGSATDPRDRSCDDPNFIVTTWWNPETRKTDDYAGACGTSMAVAFVAGVAALLHAEGLDNFEITRRIKATARDLGVKGFDEQTGAGRLDAARAVGATRPAASPAKTSSTAPRPKPTGVATVQSFARVPVATGPSNERNEVPLLALAAGLLALLTIGHALRLARAR